MLVNNNDTLQLCAWAVWPLWVLLSGSFLFQRGWGMPLVASSRNPMTSCCLTIWKKMIRILCPVECSHCISSFHWFRPSAWAFPILPWSSIKMAEGTRERLWIGVPIPCPCHQGILSQESKWIAHIIICNHIISYTFFCMLIVNSKTLAMIVIANRLFKFFQSITTWSCIWVQQNKVHQRPVGRMLAMN